MSTLHVCVPVAHFLQVRDFAWAAKTNQWSAMRDGMDFCLILFLSCPQATAYIYATMAWLCQLNWLESVSHPMVTGAFAVDTKCLTEDECEAAFSILARSQLRSTMKGDYEQLRNHFQALPATSLARKRMHAFLDSPDLNPSEWVAKKYKPKDNQVAFVKASLLVLVDDIRNDSPALPAFAPRRKFYPANHRGYKQPFSQHLLKPYLTLRHFQNAMDCYGARFQRLLQAPQYSTEVQSILPGEDYSFLNQVHFEMIV